VPSGERWIHEVKFDGYRVQVHLANNGVKVFTRRGNDWTNRFKKIADDAWHINAGSAIIDGEVVVPSQNGTTDFAVLQNELKGKSTKIVMVAFDLLYLNGYDLRHCWLRSSIGQSQLRARSAILSSRACERIYELGLGSNFSGCVRMSALTDQLFNCCSSRGDCICRHVVEAPNLLSGGAVTLSTKDT
jgi:hypothetical protein